MSEYVAPPYVQSDIIEYLHDSSRGGRTNIILAVSSDDASDMSDYIVGVAYTSIFIMITFLCWIFVLVILQCLGKKTVGFCSGSSFRYPPSYLPKTGTGNSGATTKGKKYFTPHVVRATFMSFAGFILVSVYMLVNQGVDVITDTANTWIRGSRNVQDQIENGEKILLSLIDIGEKSIPIRDDVVDALELSTFCPNEVVAKAYGETFEYLSVAQDTLNALGDFYGSQLRDVLDSLETQTLFMDDLEDTVNQYANSIVKQWLPAYWIVLVVLICFLMSGATLAGINSSPKRFQTFLLWIILPIFLLWTIASWIMSGASIAAATANADFCSGGSTPGSPDETVMGFTNIYIDDELSLTYEGIRYYVQECAIYPYQFLDDLMELIEQGIQELNLLKDEVFTFEIARICGNENMDSTRDSVDSLLINFNFILKDTERTEELLDCEIWNSIYVNTIHIGFCDQALDAFLWIFSTLLAIGVCSMVMISLRASIYPTVFPVKRKTENASSDLPSNVVVTGMNELKEQEKPSQKVAPLYSGAEEEPTSEKVTPLFSGREEEPTSEKVTPLFSGREEKPTSEMVTPLYSGKEDEKTFEDNTDARVTWENSAYSNAEQEKESTVKNVMVLAADDTSLYSGKEEENTYEGASGPTLRHFDEVNTDAGVASTDASAFSNVAPNPELEKESTVKNVMNLAADDDDDSHCFAA